MLQLLSSSLSVREALSGISGSISLAAWILLLVPQLVENVKNGNADGVSTAFLCAWFLGDITNLIGSIWAGLLPTVITLALYFCFADFVLLAQVFYYHRLSEKRKAMVTERRQSHSQRPHVATVDPEDPRQALLPRRNSTRSHMGRRRSSARRRDSLSALMEKKPSTRTVVIRNLIAIMGTCLAGALGWFIAWKTGAWSSTDDEPDKKSQVMGAQVLGYVSAILYLGARIPQIIQNYRKQSCEGLSMLFFMLSLLGNLSYGAGILFHSTQREYVIENAPWLLGSLGTMAEDVMIFCQFHIYKTEDDEADNSAIV